MNNMLPFFLSDDFFHFSDNQVIFGLHTYRVLFLSRISSLKDIFMFGQQCPPFTHLLTRHFSTTNKSPVRERSQNPEGKNKNTIFLNNIARTKMIDKQNGPAS